jgi:transcriptional regulator of arginine metabolism
VTPLATKVRRHRLILDLVREHPIASQEALADELAQHGHRVTQSTLSRDLKELRILRVPEENGYRYLPAGEEEAVNGRLSSPSLGGIAMAEVIAVAANEVSLVLRTQTGRAQGVAVYVDALNEPEILATVAGDDTVLVIPRSIQRIGALERRLCELFALPAAPRSPRTASRRTKQ